MTRARFVRITPLAHRELLDILRGLHTPPADTLRTELQRVGPGRLMRALSPAETELAVLLLRTQAQGWRVQADETRDSSVRGVWYANAKLLDRAADKLARGGPDRSRTGPFPPMD